jgi:hypothetical protein
MRRGPGVGKVVLQRRDRLIIECLLERGWETIEYLHGRFFPGLSRKRVLNRLRDLCRAGYLERLDCDSFDSPHEFGSVYRLTKRTRYQAHFNAAFFTGARMPTPPLRDRSIPHQVAINRAGDWLGTRFVCARDAGLPGVDRRELPDAAYIAAEPTAAGDVVFVVVDLAPRLDDGRLDYFVLHPCARTLIRFAETEHDAYRFIHRLGPSRRHLTGRVELIVLDDLRTHWYDLLPEVRHRHRPRADLATDRTRHAG